MPKIKIHRSISLSTEALSQTVEDILKTDKEIKALEPNLEVLDGKDPLHKEVKGNRVQGFFEITESNNGSDIVVELKLPLVLTPFKSIVQKKIEEKLDNIG